MAEVPSLPYGAPTLADIDAASRRAPFSLLNDPRFASPQIRPPAPAMPLGNVTPIWNQSNPPGVDRLSPLTSGMPFPTGDPLIDAAARQHMISAQMGLWNPRTGMPTPAGAQQAAEATGLGFGTTDLPGPTGILRRASQDIADLPGLNPDAPGFNERVSTRLPSDAAAARQGIQLHQDANQRINLDSIEGTSGEGKVADQFRAAPDIPTEGTTTNADVFRAAVNHMKDNLRWIYDNMHPAVRDIAKNWYDGVNKMTGELAQQYGLAHRAVAGMVARLSPSTDWYQNYSMAERILAIDKLANEGEGRLSPEQDAFLQEYVDGLFQTASEQAHPPSRTRQQRAAQKAASDLEELRQTPYADLSSDQARAMWIRSHDELQTRADPTNGYFSSIHPNGYKTGWSLKKDRTPDSLSWQSYDNIADAISILRDPRLENISEMLGDGHKIRSFYNNIISPNAGEDVTADTHHIAGSHLMPLPQSDAIVERGMRGPPNVAETGSNGGYGAYVQATRELAHELGMLPRQVQSIVWEGARALFPREAKRPNYINEIKNLWRTSTDAAATRNAIGATRGVGPPSPGAEPVRIPPPDWFQ